MAIEDTFKELQAVRRGQYERIREQQRKQQRVDTAFAATNVLTRIGNAFLREQAANFINNEDNMARKAKYKSFLNTANNTIEEYKQAEAFDGGVEAYLINKRKNFLMNDAQQEYAELSELNETELNRYINNEATQWASQNVEAFRNEYNSALQLGSYEDYEAALAQEYQGPRNVGEFLWRGARGFFAGKNKNQIRAANVQSSRARLMEQAGVSVQAFDKAVNKGYDVDSAERIAKAVSDKILNVKEDELIEGPIPSSKNIVSEDKTATIQYITNKYRRPDGSTYETIDFDLTDPQTALYAERIDGATIQTRLDIGSQKVEELTDSWNIPYIKTTIPVVDRVFGNTVEQVVSIVYNPAQSQTSALREVDEEQESMVRNILNETAQVPMYTPGNDTFMDSFESFHTAQYGDEPTDPQITQARSDGAKLIAAKTRIAIQTLSTDLNDEFSGQQYAQDLATYFDEVAPLVALAETRSYESRKTTTGEYIATKGYEFKPENMQVELVASLVNLENEATAPTISAELLSSMLDNISLDEVASLNNQHKKDLLRAMTKDQSVADWYKEGAAMLDQAGYDQYSVARIAAIMATLDHNLIKYESVDTGFKDITMTGMLSRGVGQ